MTSAFAWNGPWPVDFSRHGGRNRRQDSHHEHHHMHHEDDQSSRRGRGRNRGSRHEHPRGFGFVPGFGPGPGGPWGGGFPPGLPPMPGGPGGPPPFMRGRKARRGDVRAAILALLAESPLNGYQVMQAIAERSHGAWRPSPGAVYPALQQLSDEGLIQPTGEGRRTLYELTEAGTAYVAEHASEVDAPWEAMTPQIDDEVWEVMNLAQQTSTALMQVVQSASPSQLARAKKVLEDGRRQLYQILADGPTDSESGGQ